MDPNITYEGPWNQTWDKVVKEQHTAFRLSGNQRNQAKLIQRERILLQAERLALSIELEHMTKVKKSLSKREEQLAEAWRALRVETDRVRAAQLTYNLTSASSSLAANSNAHNLLMERNNDIDRIV